MTMMMSPAHVSSLLIYFAPPRPRTTYLSRSLALTGRLDSHRRRHFFLYVFSRCLSSTLLSRVSFPCVSCLLHVVLPFPPLLLTHHPFLHASLSVDCVCVCVFSPPSRVHPSSFSRSPSLVSRFMGVLSERTDTGMCNFSLKRLSDPSPPCFSVQRATNGSGMRMSREREEENCAGSCTGKRNVCGGAKCEGKRDRDSHQGCLRLSFQERLPVSTCAMDKMGRGGLPAQV